MLMFQVNKCLGNCDLYTSRQLVPEMFQFLSNNRDHSYCVCKLIFSDIFKRMGVGGGSNQFSDRNECVYWPNMQVILSPVLFPVFPILF